MTRRRLGASLAQRVDEVLAIRIIHDDQFAPVTTIHDVRQQTRLSICGLGREIGFGRYTYQYQELTPLRADAEALAHLLHALAAGQGRRRLVELLHDLFCTVSRSFHESLAGDSAARGLS